MNDEDRLRELFCEQFADIVESLPVELDRTLSLDDLSLDSMELLELLTLMEDEFGIEMDEELFAHCTTLGEMEDLVLEQIRD